MTEETVEKLIFIKMVTGEELIGQLEEDNGKEVSLFEPVEFKRMWNNDNTTVIGASNYMLFLNDYHLKLSHADIVYTSVEVAPQVQAFYNAFMEQNPQSARNIFKEQEQQEEVLAPEMLAFDDELEEDEDQRHLLRTWAPNGNTVPH